MSSDPSRSPDTPPPTPDGPEAVARAADQLYDALIVPFTAAQIANRTHLRAVAAGHRTMALLRERRIQAYATLSDTEREMERVQAALSDSASALAESVPEGDQTAADIGMAAERHDLRHAATVAAGAYVLAAQVDDANLSASSLLIDLRGVVELLRTDLETHRADVLRQRATNDALFAAIVADVAAIVAQLLGASGEKAADAG